MRGRTSFKEYLLRGSIKLLTCEFRFNVTLAGQNQGRMPLIKLIFPLISILMPLAFGGGLPG